MAAAELDRSALWNSSGGQFADKVGPALASAATIVPTHPVHHVTGVVAIVNITPPWEGFSGPLELIADAIWTWTAAGNIFVAGTVTAAGRVHRFTYDRKTSKWYPDKIT